MAELVDYCIRNDIRLQRRARKFGHAVRQLGDYAAARPRLGWTPSLYGGRRHRRALPGQSNDGASDAGSVEHHAIRRVHHGPARFGVGRRIALYDHVKCALHAQQVDRCRHALWIQHIPLDRHKAERHCMGRAASLYDGRRYRCSICARHVH